MACISPNEVAKHLVLCSIDEVLSAPSTPWTSATPSPSAQAHTPNGGSSYFHATSDMVYCLNELSRELSQLKNELFRLTRARRQRRQDAELNLQVSVVQARLAVVQVEYNELARCCADEDRAAEKDGRSLDAPGVAV